MNSLRIRRTTPLRGKPQGRESGHYWTKYALIYSVFACLVDVSERPGSEGWCRTESARIRTDGLQPHVALFQDKCLSRAVVASAGTRRELADHQRIRKHHQSADAPWR